MPMAQIHQGPIERYLRATGMTIEAFEAKLREGDAGACSIFAAEMVYGAISDLMVTIEGTRPQQ